MGEPLVRVEDAAFGHDGRAVLRDVSLDVHARERVALVGGNGSGKTTLLRGLLGLAPPLAGRVARRPGLRIGWVPQRETLDPRFPLTGFDVALLGTYGDVPPWRRLGAVERGRARSALAVCRAEALARRAYGALSGGERQRVLLARALASEPELLLLDEPTSGIDRDAEAAIFDTLERLVAERGIAVWVVTHHLRTLRGRLDRVAELDAGRLTWREAA